MRLFLFTDYCILQYNIFVKVKEGEIMFDALINGFDFNPFEPGNPMTLGLAEELGHKRYVNCNTQNFWEDDYCKPRN